MENQLPIPGEETLLPEQLRLAERRPPEDDRNPAVPPGTSEGARRLAESKSDEIPAILAAIETAHANGRDIRHTTAAAAARLLSSGPDSALACLAGCGAIRTEGDLIYHELYDDAERQTPEQQAMADALLSYCLHREDKRIVDHWARDESDRVTKSGLTPQVWIYSQADYDEGVLHGVWVDAFQRLEDIQQTADWLLRISPTGQHSGQPANELVIDDDIDFCGLKLPTHGPLEVIQRIGAGIAEHGEAFARWAEYVGLTNEVGLDQFAAAYRGRYLSTELYVEDELDRRGVYRQLDAALERSSLTEDVRRRVRIDVEGLARDLETDKYVVAASDGGVHVFEPVR